MRRAVRLAGALLPPLLAACALLSPGRRADPPQPVGSAAEADAGTAPAARSLEEEEAILEGLPAEEAEAGGDPIAALISSLAAPAPGGEDGGAEGPPPEMAQPHDDVETAPDDPATAGAAPTAPDPTAFDVWSLSDEACLAALAAAGVAVSRPDFETPFVRQPLLLDGRIDDVAIRPRWRRPIRVNEVMDCRLIVALRGLARAAREQGFTELLFYSTYRPIQEPPADCPSGKAGRKCRAARAAWDKAKAGKASMHRRGLAIDLGWLTAADGSAVAVADDYERRAGTPPCDAGAETDLGRRLRDLACALHDRKIFNVVLTPNANEAHRNHFHFDVTPGARWYIVR